MRYVATVIAVAVALATGAALGSGLKGEATAAPGGDAAVRQLKQIKNAIVDTRSELALELTILNSRVGTGPEDPRTILGLLNDICENTGEPVYC